MFSFTIKGNPTQISGKLSGLDTDTRSAVKDFLTRVATHAAERSRENAPQYKNVLRPSTIAIPVVETSQKMTSGVQSTTQYAILMHEFQICYNTPKGQLDDTPRAGPLGRLYRLGPVTRTLPSQPEGGPGGKFIARVLNYHANTYLQMLDVAISNVLRKYQ